ncbi:hypothetical protein LLH06_07815 [Mucilaginibacter daejeonensis]|uniref:hypothetical protein n=1 Tax=Mucilaginibacter daejeonensis TaxID=398049 RepID=UPI001D178981|nr:hypothetical protein [Mucilaginibacter daejeonensis]UEG54869.1 hypothetical protein LLH06_07815 [Mucilaginibacter daejeonensis]
MKSLKSILSVAAVVACLTVTAEAKTLTAVADTSKMSKMDHKMDKKSKMSKMDHKMDKKAKKMDKMSDDKMDKKPATSKM